MPLNNTDRFSNRVANYVKFRPNYPPEIIPFLAAEHGLTPAADVADIGSGTGISSEPFLDNGNTVYGVEPNGPMREAAESLLGHYANFVSVDGSAEQTGLAENSADFVVAGTAFHWFDREKTRQEFDRILRPNGTLVLMWNERNTDDLFQQEYDQFLQDKAIDYNKVGHRNVTVDKLEPFFAPTVPQLTTFPNAQTFELDGLKGRALSSSYAPAPGHPKHVAFMSALADLFHRHQRNDQITFSYTTKLYIGQLT